MCVCVCVWVCVLCAIVFVLHMYMYMYTHTCSAPVYDIGIFAPLLTPVSVSFSLFVVWFHVHDCAFSSSFSWCGVEVTATSPSVSLQGLLIQPIFSRYKYTCYADTCCRYSRVNKFCASSADRDQPFTSLSQNTFCAKIDLIIIEHILHCVYRVVDILLTSVFWF